MNGNYVRESKPDAYRPVFGMPLLPVVKIKIVDKFNSIHVQLTKHRRKLEKDLSLNNQLLKKES